MKISAKARYGLAAVISMAEKRNSEGIVALINLAERLEISRMYLEQVFSLLKRGGIVTSLKGAQGGYQLARPAKDITVFDILSSIETTLFEKTEETVAKSDESIERAMQELVFTALDTSLKKNLMSISLEDIVIQTEEYKSTENYMYYL